MSAQQLHHRIDKLGCSASIRRTQDSHTTKSRFPAAIATIATHAAASSAHICHSLSPLRYELGVVLHVFLVNS